MNCCVKLVIMYKIVCSFLAIRHFMLYLCRQFYEGVMKRILLSLFFLLTWMGSATLADTPVTNGQGQTQKLTVFSSPDWSSSKYVPVVGYDANMYQKHEMIYPADYLQDMENCNISQMDFYTSDTKAQKVWTATFKVYLKEVAQSSFPSENITFTNFTDDDLVYTGQLDATGDIMSIVFDKSFFYQGGNLLVGIHLTQPGNHTTAFFLGKKMSYASNIWGKKSSSGSLDQVVLQNVDRDFLPKVTFCYSPAEQQVLVAPSTISVDDVALEGATIKWTSTASAWQICVNDDEENLIETTEKNYTFSGWERDSYYEVKVRAVNGTDVSKWSESVTIRTLYCSPDKMVTISYELHDSFGDGWGANAIVVKDALTNEELDLKWTIGTGYDNSGTLPVCLGRKIYFVWEGSGYANECSYVVRDPFGEVIFEGSNKLENPVFYTANLDCPRPIELKASDVTENSAAIDWNERGGATQWQICINHDMENLILVDNNPYMLTDLEFDTQYTLMVRSYYDANIVSTWSEPITFTTAEICPKPKNLTSVPEATEATLSWDGTLDNYVLQYNAGWKLGEDIKVYGGKRVYSFDLQRYSGKGSILIRHYNATEDSWLHLDDIVLTNPEGTTVFSEDFENCEWGMPAKLSSIDQDGDSYGWEILSNNYEDHWVQFEGHSGISSTCWKHGGVTLTPDDWLLISDVDLGGTLSFMGHAQITDDRFDILAVYVFADKYIIEEPISDGSTSFVAKRLVNNAPYLWRVKGVRETDESRWASSSFVTRYDPHAIATGVQIMDNGQWTMDNYSDEWYTIDGQKLSDKPTKKGVYIYNGKRVVIR